MNGGNAIWSTWTILVICHFFCIFLSESTFQVVHLLTIVRLRYFDKVVFERFGDPLLRSYTVYHCMQIWFRGAINSLPRLPEVRGVFRGKWCMKSIPAGLNWTFLCCFDSVTISSPNSKSLFICRTCTWLTFCFPDVMNGNVFFFQSSEFLCPPIFLDTRLMAWKDLICAGNSCSYIVVFISPLRKHTFS